MCVRSAIVASSGRRATPSPCYASSRNTSVVRSASIDGSLSAKPLPSPPRTRACGSSLSKGSGQVRLASWAESSQVPCDHAIRIRGGFCRPPLTRPTTRRQERPLQGVESSARDVGSGSKHLLALRRSGRSARLDIVGFVGTPSASAHLRERSSLLGRSMAERMAALWPRP